MFLNMSKDAGAAAPVRNTWVLQRSKLFEMV